MSIKRITEDVSISRDHEVVVIIEHCNGIDGLVSKFAGDVVNAMMWIIVKSPNCKNEVQNRLNNTNNARFVTEV